MFAANAMWGLMSPVAKFAMSCGAIGAFAVTELRIVGAAALFWIASFFQKPERVRDRDMMKMFAASMLAIVFNQGCFIFGVKMVSPVDASIITSMPLIALVLSAIFLKEVINGRKVIGISLGAAGALMLVMEPPRALQRKAHMADMSWVSCLFYSPSLAMRSILCYLKGSSENIRQLP